MKSLLLGLVILLALAACAADTAPAPMPEADGEPAASGALAPVTAVSANPPTPAPNAASDRNAAGEPDEAPAAETDEAPAGDAPASSTGASQPVSPVVVDLSQITPQPAATSEPVEMPHPGRPTDGLGGILRLVTEHAARRQGVEMETVALVDYEEIVWPNAGLGCPEADMMYLSMLTPGYKITLAVDDVELTYHTNQQERFVLCANGKPVGDQ